MVTQPKKKGRPVKHPTIRLSDKDHERFVTLYTTVTDIQDLLVAFPQHTQKQLTLYANRHRLKLTKAAWASCRIRGAYTYSVEQSDSEDDLLPPGPTGMAWHRVMVRRYTRICHLCRDRHLTAYMIRYQERWYCRNHVPEKQKLDTVDRETVR